MDKKIIIEKNRLTTRMALLINGEFVNYYIESALEPNLQNKIVIGQVKQVVKNLSAAFVDYGEDKNGMLHFKQIPEVFRDKLQMGYRLPVQIVKQNIGEKGHKLTSKLNLVGKYLVCLPFEPGINISKKISNTAFRDALKKNLQAAADSSYGFIVRTHAQEASLEDIIQDASELTQKAHDILKGSQYLSKGTVLYEEPSLILQIIMEHLGKKDPVEVVCNDETMLKEVKQLLAAYPYHKETKLVLCEGETSIFGVYSLQKKIDELLRKKVWLKNGGNLMIDYTEAMTIVDVNSAKAVLTKNPEKATFELNKEAVKESILQMLRRNIAGIMIVDLVEMKKEEHRTLVYEYAKELLESYGENKTKVFPLTELGLLQFSRTRKYQAVPHQLLASCSHCHTAYVKENFLQAVMQVESKLKMLKLSEGKQIVYLEAHADFYDQLKNLPVISMLENYYPVKIELVKSSSLENKKILCQFYQR